jgi:hypothetical protein
MLQESTTGASRVHWRQRTLTNKVTPEMRVENRSTLSPTLGNEESVISIVHKRQEFNGRNVQVGDKVKMCDLRFISISDQDSEKPSKEIMDSVNDYIQFEFTEKIENV